jgi:aldose 1-dehydrogenase [NAD(P)+]
VLGHLALGKVVETGPHVKNLSPGDLVVPLVRRDCGRCLDARADLCPHPEKTRTAGLSGAHGFARELFVDGARNLIRVPPEAGDLGLLLPHLAAVDKAHHDLAETRHRFHFFCYNEQDAASPPALVTGLGPTGILAAYHLSLHNYRVAVFGRRDTDDLRGEALRPLNLEYVNTTRYPVANLAKSGYRFRVLLETTGDPAYLLSLFPLLGNNTVMALLGAPLGECPLSLDAGPLLRQVVEGNMMVLGSTKAGRDAFESAAHQLVELADLYRDSLLPLLSDRYPFEQFAQALARNSRDTVLPVLELS